MPVIPDHRSARTLIWRGLVVWASVRATVTVFAFLLQRSGQGGVLQLSPRSLLGVVVLAIGFGWIETRRQHEVRFLANLGVGPTVILGTLLAPALVGELLIAMATQ